MDSTQEETVGMFVKVKTFFANNTAALSPTPIVNGTIAPALDSLIEAIFEEDETATADTGPVTEQKENLRLELNQKGYSLAGAVAGYYTLTVPDSLKAGKCRFQRTYLYQLRDMEMYTKLRIVADLAVPVKALLVPYGWTSAQVDAFVARVDDYLKIVQAPRDAIGARGASVGQLARNINATRDYLEESSDTVMQIYFDTNRELFDYYQRARATDQSGGGAVRADFEQEGTLETPGTLLIDLDLVNINSNSGIRLKNTATPAGGSLEAYFVVTPGTPAGAVVTVAPGQTFDGLMAQLGYAGTVTGLEIKNTGPGSAGFELKVYY